MVESFHVRRYGDYQLAGDGYLDAPGGLVVFGIVGIIQGINEITEALSGD